MNWHPASIKPSGYKTVLLALVGRDEYTVGHYANKVDKWIGFAGNQSPPIYEIEYSLVTHWCEISPPSDQQGQEK